MITYAANQLWSNAVQVYGKTQYRVTFDQDEAHITAPGLEITVELEDDIHPLEDLEACAIVLVAQLEGGLEL